MTRLRAKSPRPRMLMRALMFGSGVQVVGQYAVAEAAPAQPDAAGANKAAGGDAGGAPGARGGPAAARGN